jgi:hypothetical protein
MMNRTIGVVSFLVASFLAGLKVEAAMITTSGRFEILTPACNGSPVVCSGAGTKEINYGVPFGANGFQSSVRFDGVNANLIGTPVTIGQLTFVNGETLHGPVATEIEGFHLIISSTSNGAAQPDIDLTFRVITTTNLGTPGQDVDSIVWTHITGVNGNGNVVTQQSSDRFCNIRTCPQLVNTFSVAEGLPGVPVALLANVGSLIFAGFGEVGDPDRGSLSLTTIPEPLALDLIIVGMLGMLLVRRRLS